MPLKAHRYHKPQIATQLAAANAVSEGILIVLSPSSLLPVLWAARGERSWEEHHLPDAGWGHPSHLWTCHPQDSHRVNPDLLTMAAYRADNQAQRTAASPRSCELASES